MLLRQAQIPFILAAQDADEQACDWTLGLEKTVASIASYKMEHVLLPHANEGTIAFVLTADTLSQDVHGRLNGKAEHYEEAVAKIKDNRCAWIKLATGFCLEKKRFQNGSWKTIDRIEQVHAAEYYYDIPDSWIAIYLKRSPALACAGSIAIEEYGGQFFKEIRGSYTTIIGLPMFELREALEKMGFFDNLL